MNLKISKENMYYYMVIFAIILVFLAYKGGEIMGTLYYCLTH